MTYFDSGTYNAECQLCADLLKRNQLRKNYEGFLVCEQCWEPRPPQEFKQPKLRGTIPAKDISQANKQAMEDSYDEDDHTIVFENDQVVNPNQP